MRSIRSHRLPFFAALLTLVVSAAACGSDDTPLAAGDDPVGTTATDGIDDGTVAPDEGGDEMPPAGAGEPEPVVDDSSGYLPTSAMADVVDRSVHPIDEVVVSDDDTVLGVRYQASAEPCSGAVVTVLEDGATVTVTLETGLNPEAATMSCVAQVMSYELAADLGAPLGERTLVLSGPDDAERSSGGEGNSDSSGSEQTGGDDGENGAMDDAGLSAPDDFIGLELEAARDLAEREGRAWRIGREDDEVFAVTADYNPERVTFEIDKGVVTAATLG